ncbi:enoyl-CoA hydratase/isomerase family protein, partial [Pseudomonas sp. 2822-17]|uniref:enoyl-CoA hydratase/isomerase family protein n=1 Tax=Pseudomonas sp. 2822-17 TaxID=1712678 RepID=UPI00117B215E
PEKRNAVDFDVIKLLEKYLQKFRNNKKISLLIIRGEGKGFCSGGDLEAFHQLKTSSEAKKMLQPMCEVLKSIVTFPAITVS